MIGRCATSILAPVGILWICRISEVLSKQEQEQQRERLDCDLFLADSTIPGAGIGIFSGVDKAAGEGVGDGDKAIPLVDTYWHNGKRGGEHFFNPTADYVWDGVGMGMRLEVFDRHDISAFWPGVDAMVNAHSGLLNLQKSTPVYDEGGVHRSKHPGAGSMSPYEASIHGSSLAVRDIPAGGELFKSYGDNWFLAREHLGQIPVTEHYTAASELLIALQTGCEILGISPKILYDDYFRPIKNIWNSRTLNAFHDFSWSDIEQILEARDFGVLLQANATRPLDWLHEHGRCLDHIVHKRSTVDGAGAGAFAKRNLPKGTIVSGTPLLVFPDKRYFDMYEFQECPDGTMARDINDGPYGHQLLLNYCFGHGDSDMVLCPYGNGVNYINHNKTRANVEIRWTKEGTMSHKDEYLRRQPGQITDYSTKVAFDYVAIRDIWEGEELFLNYGDAWEEKFLKLHADWQGYDRSHLDAYVSATAYNNMYATDPLYTSEELLSFNPHPDNLSLRCHHQLSLNASPEGVFEWNNSLSELADDWFSLDHDNTGFACEVIGRVDDGPSYAYIVRLYSNPDADEEETMIIYNVPREAIKFFDKPYTTDMHMMGAFRHTIGIPDDMLPDAWRRTPTDEGKQYSETLEEACASKPWSSQYIQSQPEPEPQPKSRVSVRNARSNIRGVGRGLHSVNELLR